MHPITNKNTERQENPSMKEVMAKIIDIDGLPFYEEARQLVYFLDPRPRKNCGGDPWWMFCKKHGVHNCYNVEFIDALVEEIKRLNQSPIIEICAGNGKLSYQLRKKGIDIIATDINPWEPSQKENLVEKLSHKEALEKYNPRIVIASWVPYRTRIGFNVLDFLTVNYFIDIGHDVYGATWMTEEVYQRKDFEMIQLMDVEKYSICRSDYPTAMYHSGVRLFKRLQFTKQPESDRFSFF